MEQALPKKPPQFRTDLAAVIRVALGPREYQFGENFGNPNTLSKKQREMFTRVGKRVNHITTFTVSGVVVREERSLVQAFRSTTPRDYAVQLLNLYKSLGGRS